MNKFLSLFFALTSITSLYGGEELILDGDYPVTVDSGSTEVISRKVTGSGRLILHGGGMLVLNNAENDFTGGIVVSNGIVRADASGAFGTGTISLEGDNPLRQVRFNALNGVFQNSIMLCTVGTVEKVIYIEKDVELNGDITLHQDYADSKNYLLCYAQDAATRTTINGNIDVSHLQFIGNGTFVCNGKMKVSTQLIAGAGGKDYYGTLTLSNSNNEISVLQIVAFKIQCKQENVLYKSGIYFNYGGRGNSSSYCCIYLNGYNQTFKFLKYNTANEYGKISRHNSCVRITTDSDKPATVILAGPGSAYGYCRLSGPVSVVVDKSQDAQSLYQRFLYRENSMSGNFTVNNGSCYFMDGVTSPNVTNMVIAGGITYVSNVTNLCPKLEKWTIQGGTVTFQDGCVNAIGPKTKLYLSSQAKLYCYDGITNTVRNLYLDGKKMSAGIYNYENLAPMKPNSGTYNGALVVTHGSSLGIVVR